MPKNIAWYSDKVGEPKKGHEYMEDTRILNITYNKNSDNLTISLHQHFHPYVEYNPRKLQKTSLYINIEREEAKDLYNILGKYIEGDIKEGDTNTQPPYLDD